MKITRRGRSLLDKVDPQVMGLHRRQFGHMDERDLRKLCELLTEARKKPETKGIQ